VKKNQGGGQWKDELDVRMDFPVCGVANVFCISYLVFYVRIHKYCITNLFLL
jgi:hypothetical protein